MSYSILATVTKYHRQGVGGVGAYKQQNLLSQSSGGWGSMENLRSGAQTAVFSLCPPMVEEGKGALWDLP